VKAWGLSPSKYVNQAVKNCVSHLTEKFAGKYQIQARADSSFPTDYCAKINVTEPSTPEYASFFMHLIGVLGWMVELGRVDIVTEVSMLLLYLAYP
jgi:hypothetical protein